MLYISSNAPRIARALFEIVLRKGWAGMTDIMLTICKVHAALQRLHCFQVRTLTPQCFELRLWPHQHPLHQFEGANGLTWQVLEKLQERDMTLDRLQVR